MRVLAPSLPPCTPMLPRLRLTCAASQHQASRYTCTVCRIEVSPPNPKSRPLTRILPPSRATSNTKVRSSAITSSVERQDEEMADPERFEIGLEGVADDDVGGAALGCENGEELGLDLGEGRSSHGERCLWDA